MCIFVAEFDMASMIPRADVEALQADHDMVLGELQVLETAAIKLCQEIEGLECQTTGSSIANRLSSLGSRVIERLRGALRLGVQKTLGLTSTHCQVNFTHYAMATYFPRGLTATTLWLMPSRKWTRPSRIQPRLLSICLTVSCSLRPLNVKLLLLQTPVHPDCLVLL
jgi:hypothetical protein